VHPVKRHRSCPCAGIRARALRGSEGTRHRLNTRCVLRARARTPQYTCSASAPFAVPSEVRVCGVARPASRTCDPGSVPVPVREGLRAGDAEEWRSLSYVCGIHQVMSETMVGEVKVARSHESHLLSRRNCTGTRPPHYQPYCTRSACVRTTEHNTTRSPIVLARAARTRTRSILSHCAPVFSCTYSTNSSIAHGHALPPPVSSSS